MISGRFERKSTALEPLLCGANRSGVSRYHRERKPEKCRVWERFL